MAAGRQRMGILVLSFMGICLRDGHFVVNPCFLVHGGLGIMNLLLSFMNLKQVHVIYCGA